MRVLTYEDFVWTFNKLKERGLDIMKYYKESKNSFELRFNHEAVEYKTVVRKVDIPDIKSRFDVATRNDVSNIPISQDVKIYNGQDVAWFKKEELFDYMPCLSFG